MKLFIVTALTAGLILAGSGIALAGPQDQVKTSTKPQTQPQKGQVKTSTQPQPQKGQVPTKSKDQVQDQTKTKAKTGQPSAKRKPRSILASTPTQPTQPAGQLPVQ